MGLFSIVANFRLLGSLVYILSEVVVGFFLDWGIGRKLVHLYALA